MLISHSTSRVYINDNNSAAFLVSSPMFRHDVSTTCSTMTTNQPSRPVGHFVREASPTPWKFIGNAGEE